MEADSLLFIRFLAQNDWDDLNMEIRWRNDVEIDKKGFKLQDIKNTVDLFVQEHVKELDLAEIRDLISIEKKLVENKRKIKLLHQKIVNEGPKIEVFLSGKKFAIPYSFLSQQSLFFDALLQEKVKVIDLQDEDGQTLDILMNYLNQDHTGLSNQPFSSIPLNKDNIISVLILANKYLAFPFIDKCMNWILEQRIMDQIESDINNIKNIDVTGIQTAIQQAKNRKANDLINFFTIILNEISIFNNKKIFLEDESLIEVFNYLRDHKELFNIFKEEVFPFIPVDEKEKNPLALAEKIGHWMQHNQEKLKQITRISLQLDLSSLPPEIGLLSGLKELNIALNKLSTLPEEISQCTNLKILVLHENKLTHLPAGIGQLKALRELYLADNQLTSFPSEIGGLTSLIELDVTNNYLMNLPASIGDLKNLRKLRLKNNRLTAIPAEINNLTNLRMLSLSDNRLTSLPSKLDGLQRLIILNLDKNHLKDLPNGIGELKALETLNLKKNYLTSIPNEICKINLLETLDLIDNQITSLPPDIVNWKKIKLYLDGNPLESLPKGIRSVHISKIKYI